MPTYPSCSLEVSQFLTAKYPATSIAELSRKLKVEYHKIVSWLKYLGIHRPKPAGCTEEVKCEIIRLYTVEKRGKQHIGKVVGRSDVCIANWLKSWGIPTWDRVTIQKTAMGICGPTCGFRGRTHSSESKRRIVESSRKAWTHGREAKSSHAHTYKTEAGPVLGTWEVAYLQQFREQGLPLPKRCRIRIKTPYGTYQPDFELDNALIEIKSKFTYSLALGQNLNFKSPQAESQLRKIQYVNDNIRKVNIIVMTAKAVKELFKKAQESGGVLL